ncbi:MAG TPA: hypothetical protein VML75_04585 [Kofleriaceae bacterium]|nr:hypothetical protein [Kofleriaceae bacterium]
MQLNERFVVGRVVRRMLRAPAIDGWLADELTQGPGTRTHQPLKKLGTGLALAIPDQPDLARLGASASALIGTLEQCELLIGWPEHLVIVRSGGAVSYAEGDIVHFGRLALDPEHAIARTGYDYLAETGAEVRVELTATAGGTETVHVLGPGDAITVGPYRIEHERSFDPSDRPSGARHHGYFFRCRRNQDAPPAVRPAGVPHPLDLDTPTPIIALARARGLLDEDEALLGEPTVLAALLDRYEGPRHNLEEALGTDPAVVRRLGEALAVESPIVTRGAHGEPHHGRAMLTLDAAGGLRVRRDDHGARPGRLRKRH